jgi:cysteine desulfurase
MSLVYLDNNASTRPDPLVVDAVARASTDLFANPASAQHKYGHLAAEAVAKARAEVAQFLDAPRNAVVFTSGATEANNLAIKGVWTESRAGHSPRDKVLVGATEHPAVLEAAERIAKWGATVVRVPVCDDGQIDLRALESLLDERTLLVSVMAANSETGTLHPLGTVVALARAAGALVHTDATQHVGRLPFSMADSDVDLVSISGHKMHGPKGVGALLVRRGVPIAPQLDGGDHERGRRSGTLNTPGIIGLGVAAELAARRMDQESRVRELRDRLYDAFQSAIEGVTLNGSPTERLPNTLNVRFEGADAEAVMARTPSVACSSGSACHSGASSPSHVLRAMGLSDEQAHESIRFSLSHDTTPTEVDQAAAAISASVASVRQTVVGAV